MAQRKRQEMKTNSGKRYVRRDDQGRFEKEVSVGSSLSHDRRKRAKTKVSSGEGDRGDRRRRKG